VVSNYYIHPVQLVVFGDFQEVKSPAILYGLAQPLRHNSLNIDIVTSACTSFIDDRYQSVDLISCIYKAAVSISGNGLLSSNSIFGLEYSTKYKKPRLVVSKRSSFKEAFKSPDYHNS
jgi:hypothetical protein